MKIKTKIIGGIGVLSLIGGAGLTLIDKPTVESIFTHCAEYGNFTNAQEYQAFVHFLEEDVVLTSDSIKKICKALLTSNPEGI